jgi:hypothetical protein
MPIRLPAPLFSMIRAKQCRCCGLRRRGWKWTHRNEEIRCCQVPGLRHVIWNETAPINLGKVCGAGEQIRIDDSVFTKQLLSGMIRAALL